MEKFDSTFKSLKKEFCDDLIQSIRLDVWDQLNGAIKADEYKSKNQHAFQNIQIKCCNEETVGVILNDIKKMNDKILKKDEYYVYELLITNYVRHQNDPQIIEYSLVAMTNYSNMSYTTHRLNPLCNTPHPLPKIIELNVPLHSIFIDIFVTLKTLSLQDIFNTGSQYCTLTRLSDQWFKMLQEILNLNKKYYMNLLVSSDLQKKYEKSLDDNKKLEEDILKRKDAVEQKLRDSIPVELQCCVCFGYTDKSHILVPCGHTNYCSTCINVINQCSVCRTLIEKVQKIYK